MTTHNDELIGILRGVGFSKNEAAVYLACLELGPSSIWDIAQKSGIKRPTCYVVLEELSFKGLASSANDGKRTIYNVASPKQLQRALESRQTRLLRAMTNLSALASKAPQKPIVRLYEGIEGVMEAYNLSLDQPKGSEILIYGTAEVKKNYGDFIYRYIETRVQKGIRARGILPDNEYNREVLKTDKEQLRDTRFLPVEKFGVHTEINIFQDTICYIAHSEVTPFATVIENITLAEEEKQRFELLWDIARP